MNFYKTILLACVTLTLGCQQPSSTLPPNIIILLADDLGYGDLGCYGGVAKTPNLDQLATEGIQFTDFYSAAPNCSPARVGLLTGRFPSKVGMYNYMPAGHPMHLKAEAVTLAEMVKKKGYATGHFGKWHVSNLTPDSERVQPQPSDQGFDYSLGTTNNAQPSHLNPINFVRNGKKVGKMKGFSCQIVVEETIQWLREISPKKTPFLAFLAFHEPHKKVASPPDLIANYQQFPEKDAEYLANVENMDKAIGQLLDVLKKEQLDKNTLILFASDNGSYRNGSNGDLLGGKSFVYEGGIRVPGILHWKGKIEAGQTISEPTCLVDVMPTICDLTNVVHPNANQLDGISLLPLLSKKPLERKKPLSWFFYRTSPEIAMRIGDYTILGRDRDSIRLTHPTMKPDMDYIKNMTVEDFELYYLPSDIGQTNNIDYTSSDMGNQMKNQLVNRLQEIQAAAPVWDSLPLVGKRAKRLKKDWRQLHPTGFSN